MNLRSRAYRRVVGLAAILILAPHGSAQAPAVSAESLEQLFAALEVAAAELPRDSFDLQAIVDEVGTEPEALFEWVRDNTYFVPYKGVLRGPNGVLMDRMGNSLDRALLLRQLLILAGHNALLAVGSLDDAGTRMLLEEARPLASGRNEIVAEEDDSSALAEMFSGVAGLDAEALLARVEGNQQEAESLAELVRQRIDEQADLLIELTEGMLENDDSLANSRRQSLISEHWWVEIQTATSIIDLDPSLPDATIGQTITSPTSRFSPTSVNQLRGLSDTAHTFILRVVVERWDAGNVSEEVVLEHEIFPADLDGESITFAHLPVSDPNLLALYDEGDAPAALLAAATAESEWQPVLQVGALQVKQKSFTTSGEVKSSPGGNAAAVGGLGGSAGGMFGGFGGALEGSSEAESSHLTAEWLEYEVKIPGESPRVYRRQIFDVLGPAVRAAGATGFDFETADATERGLSLIGETEILPVVNDLTPEYVAALTAGSLLANREILLDLYRNQDSFASSDISAALTGAAKLPGPLFDLVFAQQAWNPLQTQTFPNQVGIYTRHQQLRQDETGEVVALDAIDVVNNGIGILLDPSLSRQAQLRHGVLVTNAEAVVLGVDNPQNTSEMFARSREQGISWILVTSTEQSEWQRLTLAADVRARIVGDLASGHVVVMPERPVAIGDQEVSGWWRVDPSAGLTLGMGDRGWGQSNAEYIMTTRLIAQQVFTAHCLLKWGQNSSTGLKKAGAMVLCVVAGNVGTARIAIAGAKMGPGLVLGLVNDIIGGMSLGLAASL